MLATAVRHLSRSARSSVSYKLRQTV